MPMMCHLPFFLKFISQVSHKVNPLGILKHLNYICTLSIKVLLHTSYSKAILAFTFQRMAKKVVPKPEIF